jgi:hypothetical protein
MEIHDKILSFIRIRGPCVPTTIAKNFNMDSIFASAFLSELKELGKIRISHLKIGGGSPLYYLPGQESMLQQFSNNLGEKDRRMYELLRQKLVVRDSELVPVFRLAVRQIKDFAYPVNVSVNNQRELFWKWYLLPDSEAEKIIKQMLAKGIREEQPIEAMAEIGEKKEGKIKETEKQPAEKKESEAKKGIKQELPPIQAPKREPEKQETLKKLAEKPEEKKRLEKEKPKGEFYEQAKSFLDRNNIKIIEEKMLKKGEIDFIVEIPTHLGNLRYFAKAKNKKKINDSDLSSVFVLGQSKRMPVLFLSNGELTKKAEQMLNLEFSGMKFNKI